MYGYGITINTQCLADFQKYAFMNTKGEQENMRKFVREQLMDLLGSMEQLQSKLTVVKDKQQIVQMLINCQNAAIAVGNVLEKDSSDHNQIISLLEDYCEQAFVMSQLQEEVDCPNNLSILDGIINRVKVLLAEIPLTYYIIFMPYKASMWDSLESIWHACKEDDRCECHVVPIPYYEFDSSTNRWEYRYEGAQFPAEVPIIEYQKYFPEKNRPDVAYVHNPYDDQNLVTRVDPRFYSWELKKYVNNLVYIPYYVTSGFFAQEHLALSIYQHMDYMVVQSQFTKSFCKGMNYYDKILPFGSPKLDRVIKLCQEKSSIPKLWNPLLEGKKVLMLNTSIGHFLLDGYVYLKKIKNLFKTFSKQDQVALIWRPHPLLEATIRSMRPHLLLEYNNLKAYFMENKIGVLDETPDISKTVAISDAYIGEEGSSVINLFGAAGKPIFILNNYITEYHEEEKHIIHFTDMLMKEDKLWFVTNQYNALFQMDIREMQVQYVGYVKNQVKWSCAYSYFTESGNKIYFSPNLARRPAVYDIASKRFELIGTEDKAESECCRLCVNYEKRIFYLPIKDNYIAEYNTETDEWKYHIECIQELRGEVGNDIITYQGMTFRCSVCGEDVWITATYTNRVLKFNMKTGAHKICTVGSNGSGYSGIVAEEKFLWLTEVRSGEIVRWDRRTGKAKTFCMPEGFKTRTGVMNRNLAHLSMINMGKWVITVPGLSNCMVKLNKNTGEVSLLIYDFWKISVEAANGYNPEFNFSSEFGAKLNQNSIIVQRNYDNATAVINVEDETYEMFYPTLSKNDFSKLTGGGDGFEKLDEKSGFFRRESKIFSFEGFLDDLIHGRLSGVRERQIKELCTLAANLDGTCGIKVHEYMMNVIEMN